MLSSTRFCDREARTQGAAGVRTSLLQQGSTLAGRPREWGRAALATHLACWRGACLGAYQAHPAVRQSRHWQPKRRGRSRAGSL